MLSKLLAVKMMPNRTLMGRTEVGGGVGEKAILGLALMSRMVQTLFEDSMSSFHLLPFNIEILYMLIVHRVL